MFLIEINSRHFPVKEGMLRVINAVKYFKTRNDENYRRGGPPQ